MESCSYSGKVSRIQFKLSTRFDHRSDIQMARHKEQKVTDRGQNVR